MLVAAKSTTPNVDDLASCAKTNWRRATAGTETSMCDNGWSYPEHLRKPPRRDLLHPARRHRRRLLQCAQREVQGQLERVAVLEGRRLGDHPGFVAAALPADAGGAVMGVGSLSGRHHESAVAPPTGLVTYVCPDGDVQITVPFGR